MPVITVPQSQALREFQKLTQKLNRGNLSKVEITKNGEVIAELIAPGFTSAPETKKSKVFEETCLMELEDLKKLLTTAAS
jgi:hypothetical protein